VKFAAKLRVKSHIPRLHSASIFIGGFVANDANVKEPLKGALNDFRMTKSTTSL